MRIFFTTDVHGSERCFLKFVNAAKFYDVDTLIMAGDVTGKAIVPFVKQPGGGYVGSFLGRSLVASTDTELVEMENLVRINGFYPFRSDSDDVAALTADPELRDKRFLALMRESLERWVAIAEERLAGTSVRCFITPGNDDHLELDSVLEGSERVVNPEGKLIRIENGKHEHEMISCGWSGPTPFDTPRECSEEALEQRIEAMACELTSLDTAIFNLHNPPFDSRLDLAPALDGNLRVQSEGGQSRLVPVGSVAVRRVIEKYQPLISLHGHIHESRGETKIGRCLCINPGSEYSEGILRGAVIDLNGHKVKNAQLISG